MESKHHLKLNRSNIKWCTDNFKMVEVTGIETYNVSVIEYFENLVKSVMILYNDYIIL